MQQLADMPESVLTRVRDREITPSHVYQLSRLADPPLQETLARDAATHKWSVQRLARAVREALASEDPTEEAMASPRQWASVAQALRQRVAQSAPPAEEEREMLREIAALASTLAARGGEAAVNLASR